MKLKPLQDLVLNPEVSAHMKKSSLLLLLVLMNMLVDGSSPSILLHLGPFASHASFYWNSAVKAHNTER